MQLGARFLLNVANVNTFTYSERAQFTEGDSVAVYLQLVNRLQDLASDGFVPAFRRYCPASGATLLVTLTSLDDSRVVQRTATQPFAGDASIWTFSVSAADRLRGTVSMRLQLQEGGVATYGLVQPALSVFPKTA